MLKLNLQADEVIELRIRGELIARIMRAQRYKKWKLAIDAPQFVQVERVARTEPYDEKQTQEKKK